MQLEIHILQSFPPANLNRDENGMPKSTVFGGRPRARISSQCQKRASRKFYQENAEISVEQFAHRSRAWLQELKTLLTQEGIAEDQADVAGKLALTEGLKVKLDEKTGESKTILFLGKTELAAIANILVKNWAIIEPGITKDQPALPTKDPNIPKGIEKALIDSGKPGDVALFGRMMASLPTVNVDAAVQVAHAISVNSLQQEFDFFTAVDDLSASDDQGADHMGETGYNSSTYYRYANLNTVQLAKNLGLEEAVPTIAKAFVEAFIKAIPTGHQNSFAAHSLPAAVITVVRDTQPVSLVDAFEDPIRPSNGLSLLENSIKALDEHWGDIIKMYGDSSLKFQGIVTRTKFEQYLDNLKESKYDSLDELINKTIEAAFAK